MEFKANGVLKTLYVYTENSPEWETAILTREEFESFRKIENLLKNEKNKNEILTYDNCCLKKTIADLKSNKLELEEKIKKLDIVILDKETLYIDLKKQNENLLRINKERSNAERKIYPKKLHNGYVVLKKDSFQKIFTIKSKRNYGYRETYDIFKCARLVYKYKMQTPYLANFNIDELYDIILKDLKNNFNLDNFIFIPEDKSFLEDYKTKEFCFNLKIISDERFYLIEFLTNKPLMQEFKD